MKRMSLVVTLGLMMLLVVGCGLSAEEASLSRRGDLVEVVEGVSYPLGMVLYEEALVPQEYVETGTGALGLPLAPFCNETDMPCNEARADMELEGLVLNTPEVAQLISGFQGEILSTNISPFEHSSAVWMIRLKGNRLDTEGIIRVVLAWENEGTECEYFMWSNATDAQVKMCHADVRNTAHICVDISGEELGVKAAGLTRGYDVTCDDLR